MEMIISSTWIPHGDLDKSIKIFKDEIESIPPYFQSIELTKKEGEDVKAEISCSPSTLQQITSISIISEAPTIELYLNDRYISTEKGVFQEKEEIYKIDFDCSTSIINDVKDIKIKFLSLKKRKSFLFRCMIIKVASIVGKDSEIKRNENVSRTEDGANIPNNGTTNTNNDSTPLPIDTMLLLNNNNFIQMQVMDRKLKILEEKLVSQISSALMNMQDNFFKKINSLESRLGDMEEIIMIQFQQSNNNNNNNNNTYTEEAVVDNKNNNTESEIVLEKEKNIVIEKVDILL